jgi:hypothetical protein
MVARDAAMASGSTIVISTTLIISAEMLRRIPTPLE